MTQHKFKVGDIVTRYSDQYRIYRVKRIEKGQHTYSLILTLKLSLDRDDQSIINEECTVTAPEGYCRLVDAVELGMMYARFTMFLQEYAKTLSGE